MRRRNNAPQNHVREISFSHNPPYYCSTVHLIIIHKLRQLKLKYLKEIFNIVFIFIVGAFIFT